MARQSTRNPPKTGRKQSLARKPSRAVPSRGVPSRGVPSRGVPSGRKSRSGKPVSGKPVAAGPALPETRQEGESRRDFLILSTGSVAAVGGALAAWPFIDSLNPAADVLALSKTEVDLSGIEAGQSITVKWQGKPVFVRHRTQEEIMEARSVILADLPDPQADQDRVIEPQWLVVVGICTHLGCIPLGQRPGEPRGDFGGWFCPCHGSHYDTSGRIRRGPAPVDLIVPPYQFINQETIVIG